MDTNHQNGSNSDLATSNIKIWLPPTYTNNKIPTTPTSTNNNPATPPAPKKRRMSWDFVGKTWYERLMLIFTLLAALGAIAIPVAIAIGTNWFSYQQNQTSIQIAGDQQRETTLKTYMSDISNLVLTHNLRKSKQNDEVRVLARAETLTTLEKLDGVRKGILIQFLYQSQLINAPQSSSDHSNPIISLWNADLSYMDLEGESITFKGNHTATIINSCNANNPSTTNLGSKNMDGSLDLNGIDLSGTNLSSATIRCVDLSRANLYASGIDYVDTSTDRLTGTIMPYGRVHP